MATEIMVPALGESVTTATVARWIKQAGEAVAADEPLVELETDKVTVEVNAPSAGVLTSIAVPEGVEVEVGALLGLIDASAAGTTSSPAKAVSAGVAAPSPGAKSAAAGSPGPATSGSGARDARSSEASARTSSGGTPTGEMPSARGVDASPGVAASGATQPPSPARSAANPPGGVQPPPRPLGPVSRPAMPPAAAGVYAPLPSAAKMIAENQISSEEIGIGSGKDGRITKGDVLDFLNRPVPAPSATQPREARAPRVDEPREERVKMTRLRRTIAQRLKEAQNTAAMLTTFNEVDMSAVMALRSAYRDAFEKKHNGVRLGFMSFFVRACCIALTESPLVNAEIDGDDIVYKNFVNMGIAVGGPSGLVVPVIRDADRMGFAEIEQAIADFGRRVRDGALKLEELTGGTFSITNGGIYGSLMSTPILNPPQSAILGMHKIQERPVVADGKIEARPMMYLALSYDHRIVDGKEAVSFLVRVKEGLEDPRRMLLGL